MPPEDDTAPHHSGLQFERLVFFSDAVFAIAITLLVLDLRIPPESAGHIDFAQLADKLQAFLISFFTIGIYWMLHHRLYGTLRRSDGKLMTMNLVFLASIVFLPFPTSVLSELHLGPGTVAFYALSVAAVGLLLVALILTARRPALLAAGQTRGMTWRYVIYSLAPPAVFLASAPLALRDPRLATWSWFLVWPAVLAASRVGEAVRRRIDGAGA